MRLGAHVVVEPRIGQRHGSAGKRGAAGIFPVGVPEQRAKRSADTDTKPASVIVIDSRSPVPSWKNIGQTSDSTRASTIGKISAHPQRLRAPQTTAACVRRA